MAYNRSEKGGWSYNRDEKKNPKVETPKEQPKVEPKPKEEAVKPKVEPLKPKADISKPKIESPKPKVETPKPQENKPSEKPVAKEPVAETPKNRKPKAKLNGCQISAICFFGLLLLVFRIATKFEFNNHFSNWSELEQMQIDPDTLTLEYLTVDPNDPSYDFCDHGLGSQNRPFLIYTQRDLIRLSTMTCEDYKLPKEKLVANGPRYYSEAHYRLMQDLDCSSLAFPHAICGKKSKPFSGEFDGGGHVIRNLRIDNIVDNPDFREVALFGSVEAGYIHDLKLEDINYRTQRLCVGGLVYKAQDATIENCVVTGIIYGKSALTKVDPIVANRENVAVFKCKMNVVVTLGENTTILRE